MRTGPSIPPAPPCPPSHAAQPAGPKGCPGVVSPLALLKIRITHTVPKKALYFCFDFLFSPRFNEKLLQFPSGALLPARPPLPRGHPSSLSPLPRPYGRPRIAPPTPGAPPHPVAMATVTSRCRVATADIIPVLFSWKPAGRGGGGCGEAMTAPGGVPGPSPPLPATEAPRTARKGLTRINQHKIGTSARVSQLQGVGGET